MANDKEADIQELQAGFEGDEVSRSGRPSTDANIFVQLIGGTILTVVISVGVGIFKNSNVAGLKYMYQIINERGWVQYGELVMSCMILFLMILKSRIVKNQLSVIATNPIPADLDLSDDDKLRELRKSIMQREEYSWSIILNRIDRAIVLWLNHKDVGRVSTWAAGESSRDTSTSDSSYSLCRVLIWAIPIMGFIGTVQGLAVAVSGFGVLGGSADIGAIKSAIGQVTVGLAVAFDTTLLALLLTTFLMFPLSFIQRNEEGLFVELDNYLDDALLSRLSAGAPAEEKQQPMVIEGLQQAIEAAFRTYIPDPEKYREVFTQAIDKASASVEQRFSGLASGYETAIRSVGAELGKSAQGFAAGFQKTAHDLQTASDASVSRTVQAAQQLAVKMDEVSKLATSVQSLLQVEKAIEKGLSGISASDDFRKTLEDLRKNINATTEFCTKMSKPRVITLREE